MAKLSSSVGVLALLSEPDQNLKSYGLTKLTELVDVFWAEVSDEIGTIVSLYDDEAFPDRKRAALVASKVYYHLEQLDESLSFALGADDLFDVTLKTEYVETIIAAAIDEYVKLRVAAETAVSDEGKPEISPALESIVDRMLERCFNDKEYKQIVGIALESWRVDVLERAIVESTEPTGMLNYCFDLCMTVVENRDFRHRVLRILVRLYSSVGTPDYINMTQCLIFLNDHAEVAKILGDLVSKDDRSLVLLAYQIAFDLADSATQAFVRSVSEQLPEPAEATTTTTTTTADGEDAEDDSVAARTAKVKDILTGEPSIQLYLEYLYRNCRADRLIIDTIKDTINSRNSVLHQATVLANALMYAGTTTDQFLVDNINWLSSSVNWAKFSATASLGVIHKGHVQEGMNLLAPYLPAGEPQSPFSEGGSLFALGIINANHGAGVAPYLLDSLRNAGTNEVVQHGACLGLGIAATATKDRDIFEALNGVLYTDNAVAGEAAAIAMGLVMLGSSDDESIPEMLRYAHDTQHDKIVRGLSLGVALMSYGIEESAESLIESMVRDEDHLIRYGAMYTVALAYAGTANNAAISRLLHVAVSDVSDEVRRAAVMGLGFVLFRVPEQCPKVVALLAESYNPHVRYGAALALGISCAGTGLDAALDILEPMYGDTSDFVRQGALLAASMILMQHNEKQNKRASELRERLATVVGDKMHDILAKTGAIIGQGLLDAGGRNVSIALQSRTGHQSMLGVVGMAIFTQYWYWFPYMPFISLAFAPTALIGLDASLKMPEYTFKSNAPPSQYAFPPATKKKEKKVGTKVEAAVLSTTAKAKRRDKKKGDADTPMPDADGETKDTDMPDVDEDKPADAADKKDGEAGTSEGEGEGEGEKKEEEAAEPEAEFEILTNPSRVTHQQMSVISYDVDGRYKPVTLMHSSVPVVAGIVVLHDTQPDAEVAYVEAKPPVWYASAEDDEPAPPEPFEYESDGE